MRNHTVPALVLACALGASLPADAAAAPAAFAIHRFSTDPQEHQTVLDGAFSRGARLAVVSSDSPNGWESDGWEYVPDERRWVQRPRVRFYRFDGTVWRGILDTQLPSGIEFVDVLRGPSRDRLLLYRSDGISWFDEDSATEHRLAEASPAVRIPRSDAVPQVDITRDLNGDGRDDIVLPTFDGFQVALQSPDGSFDAAVALGPPPPFLDASPTGQAYFGEKPFTLRETGFTQWNIPLHIARVHTLDYDRDGLQDLAFWNKDRLDIHRQNEAGAFDATPVGFVPDVPIDFAGIYPLDYHYDYHARTLPVLLLSLSPTTLPLAAVMAFGGSSKHRALHGIRDVDADGIADLVVLAMHGGNPMQMRGRIEFHYGRAAPNGTSFHAAPDATVKVPGRDAASVWYRFTDLDGDGTAEVALGVPSSSQAMELAFYRQRGRADLHRLEDPRRVNTRWQGAVLGNV